MRRLILACFVLAAAVAGCAHDPNPSPTLTITPDGDPLTIDRATDFSAIIANTPRADTVTWSLTGPGAISPATGFHTVYTPPPGTASATATLTATTATGLTASVTISPTALTLTANSIPGLLAPVTVLTDAEDIPHIRCQTAIDCISVQGYIHARDRFFMMDFLRHVARAHLAEMIGVLGLDQDVQIRNLFVTRDGRRIEDALTDALAANDPEMKKLLDAYAAGVNAYLAELAAHPTTLPGEYAQLPFPTKPSDIAPWTPQDTLAMARLQQFQLSETLSQEVDFATFAAAYGPTDPRFTAWIRSAAPTGEQAHTLSPTAETIHAAPTATTPAAIAPIPALATFRTQLSELNTQLARLRGNLRPFDASVGSNNWVVAGSHSATGAAMVANDPHLSLQYPPLFHLSVMTSALASDNLDLAGGAFPGIPGALVGRGKHVGWGVTVVGYDVTDLYQEGLTACPDPTAHPGGCVLYKGAPEPLVIVPQTFMVRTETGLVNATSISGVTVPAVVAIAPHHGPIIKKLSTTAALSVRWTGMEGNTDDLRAFYGLDTATDVDSAVAALKNYATGAQNFVLADDQGNIAYDPHAFVPVRKFADVTATAPANLQAPWFPLKGFDGSAEWGDGTSDCAATGPTPVPATCWIADDALPHGKNPAKGYFMTANADPTATGVTDDNNPLAHPPYFSFDWDDSTGFRATRIQERLEAALAAGNGKLSLADMESIQSDHVSRPGKFFATYIASLPANANDATFTAARALLAKWATDGFDCPSGLTTSDPSSALDTSGTVPDDSAACFLFHAFLRQLFTNVFTDDLAVVGLGVNQLQAMKAMMYMLSANADSDTTANSFCSTANRATGAITAVRTCSSQVVAALDAAYTSIATQLGTDTTHWTWGKVHTMQPVPLIALVTTGYEPGPYARPGGAFTVDVGTPSTSSGGLAFPFGSSGNVRHISVMAASDPTTKMQLPGPEKDGPVQAGFHYPDLLAQWTMNQYFDFLLGDAILPAAVSSQTFNKP